MQQPVEQAAAVVDRLTFRGHIIQTGSDSYRLRATRAARTTGRAPAPPAVSEQEPLA